MHWTYTTADKDHLYQGDILTRTDDLLQVLRQVHPLFADTKYAYFIVLTQSCDLVRRQRNCKTPYITVAVVRDAEAAIKAELAHMLKSREGQSLCDGRYVTDRLRPRFDQEVEKILNNNLPDYFFLKADNDGGVASDSCAFLRVSIVLRAEHYDKLLAAKMCQISDVFQAKLGWLVGHNYSRVGTQDWERRQLAELVSRFANNACNWIEDARLQAVKGEIDTKGTEGTPDVVAELLKDNTIMPKSAEELFELAVRAAWKADPQVCESFLKRLKSTPEFKQAKSAAARANKRSGS